MKIVKGAFLLAAVVAVATTPALAAIAIKTPEPATFGLLASGIATIVLVRRMRKP